MSADVQSPTPAKRWPLAEAKRIAEHVQRELAGLCDRIEIAGSIRRGRPDVHDVDLVLLPRPDSRAAIERRVQASANTRILRNGPQVLAFVMHNGLQVDLYFATPAEDTLLGRIPTNWGMRMLAMTGSKMHNVKLASLAKSRGIHFHPYKGLMRGGVYEPDGQGGEKYEGGEVFCCEREEAIFEALGLPWIKPEDRETEAYFAPPREMAR